MSDFTESARLSIRIKSSTAKGSGRLVRFKPETLCLSARAEKGGARAACAVRKCCVFCRLPSVCQNQDWHPLSHWKVKTVHAPRPLRFESPKTVRRLRCGQRRLF